MESARRNFLKLAGAALAVQTGSQLISGQAVAASDITGPKKKLKILGFSGSHRPGKTTAASVSLVLDTIREKDADIETELVELANYQLYGYAPKGEKTPEDDFGLIEQKIREPNVAGFVFGTPVYFGSLSSLMKIFIEKLTVFRKDFVLRNKIVAALAVAGNRNGGQERCLEQLWTALSSQQVIFAQDGPPTAHWGGTLWNQNDSITTDEFGQNTAKNLAARVVELARLFG